MSVILLRAYFQILHTEVLKKFEKTCKDKKIENYENFSTAQRYGFNDFKDSPNTLKSLIVKDNYVKKYCKNVNKHNFNGKYLYKKHRNIENGAERVVLNKTPYTNIFFAYLGYENAKAFIHFCNKDVGKIKESQKKLQQAYLSYKGKKISDFATQYIGYYYSYKYHKIKPFLLKIDYRMRPNNFDPDTYLASSQGLHHLGDANYEESIPIEEIRGDLYEGKAEEKGGYLYIKLVNANKAKVSSELFIIGVLGSTSVKASTKRIMLSSYMGISNNGYLINGAAVLSKVDSSNLTENSDTKGPINRYLFLQRKAFRVKNQNLTTVSNLKINNHYHPSTINHLVGQYRVWNFDRQTNVYQSRFMITENYLSWLQSLATSRQDSKKGEVQKQVCLLNIHSYELRNKLFVSSHPKEGTGIINYAILDIPTVSKFDIITGVFCTIGLDDTRQPPIGGDFVMLKDDSDFDITSIPTDKITAFLGDDQKLNKLYRYLKNGTKS